MKARLTVTLDGPDGPMLVTAVEPDVSVDLPGATITRVGTNGFEVVGDEPAAFRAAANTVLRLLATAADAIASPRPQQRR